MGSVPMRQRKTLSPLTPARLHRLTLGIPLHEVALRAGISTFRASVIERDVSLAKSGELDALKNAADAIAKERDEAVVAVPPVTFAITVSRIETLPIGEQVEHFKFAAQTNFEALESERAKWRERELDLEGQVRRLQKQLQELHEASREGRHGR